MKLKKTILSLVALLICSFVYCAIPAVPDSTTANLVGEGLGGLYIYYSTSLPVYIKTAISIAVGIAMAVIPLFQAYLKANPKTTPITGWIGFILNCATWFVQNTNTDPSKKN